MHRCLLVDLIKSIQNTQQKYYILKSGPTGNICVSRFFLWGDVNNTLSYWTHGRNLLNKEVRLFKGKAIPHTKAIKHHLHIQKPLYCNNIIIKEYYDSQIKYYFCIASFTLLRFQDIYNDDEKTTHNLLFAIYYTPIFLCK